LARCDFVRLHAWQFGFEYTVTVTVSICSPRRRTGRTGHRRAA
jgi:hypothetical protein